ncbi:MAG: hypothetical protein H0V09_02020 [Gemmatimonadetes bacterium]|nr:hypothetical protein [Gemmatimonadota bacterium]
MPPLLNVLALATLNWVATLDSVPLYPDLGDHHRPIATSVPRAQQYFDQGLRLVYGFNHGEAIRAFEEGTRLDSLCVMCYWGIALASGPHVNAGMDSAGNARASAALKKVLAIAPSANPQEGAYVEALSHRYAPVHEPVRAALDSAYAAAMRGVVERYPDDLDAATLYAEALMDLRPWNYWSADGEPAPGTAEILATLERVIAAAPNHPGACHYYIHAVEARHPERAVECAERLAALMPGAGHMVHMPGHIYIRVGRYADAIESNVHAVHADETYIQSERPSGIYPGAYYPHNYHFLAFAATMAGRSAQAIEAARALAIRVPPDVARQFPEMEPLVSFLQLTLLTFGRWEELLAQPAPPEGLRFALGLDTYARGVAYAALGRGSEADSALFRLRGLAASMSPDAPWFPKPVLEIAVHALTGEIAARNDRLDEAVGHFRTAVRMEDELIYFEPPLWHAPLRHALAAVLLRAGEPAEAEALYREDLQRFPENGWSLYGLAESLRARGAAEESQAVRRRFSSAWEGSDVKLTSSHF